MTIDDTIVGIDFGTTNSLVAVAREGRPEVLVAPDGAGGLPSAVAYDAHGGVSVGRAAVAVAERRPDDVVLSVKRLLGRAPAEVGGADRPEDDDGPWLTAGGRERTPVEVAAAIFGALRGRAEAALGGAVRRAVVTVPAHFHAGQREAVREAARRAGLEPVRLLSEPVAAALAYGFDRHPGGAFAVFDLGGGTFDLSILRVDDGLVEVLAASGDDRLGGDDLDRALATALLLDAGVDPSGDVLRRAMLRARTTREALSRRLDAVFELRLDDGAVLRQRVTRGQFEHIAQPVLQRCVEPCRRALADARLRPAEVEAVLLSGGATRSPAVRRLVAEVFEQRPRADLDPEQVVALGAARQAGALADGSAPAEALLVLDSTSRWLGIERGDGAVEMLLPRGCRLPASRTCAVPAGVPLSLVHGDDEPPEPHQRLARVVVGGRGEARLRLLVDVDGRVHVTAGGPLGVDAGRAVELVWAHRGDAAARGPEVEGLAASAGDEARRVGPGTARPLATPSDGARPAGPGDGR